MRAIALTNIAYNPEAAQVFGGHKSMATTTAHYVKTPFQRNMIKGLDFSELFPTPEQDHYVELMMKREQKDNDYHKAYEWDEDSEMSENE